jgi:hypothetical protein
MLQPEAAYSALLLQTPPENVASRLQHKPQSAFPSSGVDASANTAFTSLALGPLRSKKAAKERGLILRKPSTISGLWPRAYFSFVLLIGHTFLVEVLPLLPHPSSKAPRP